MKAKHFKKLRAKAQYYDVQVTQGMFGDFRNGFRGCVVVLAYNHSHACHRAKKRGFGLNHYINNGISGDDFAHWMVKLSYKSTHWKNVYYF